MKYLKFNHDYAVSIFEGLKNKTIRIDDKNIRVGDVIQLVDKVSSNKPQQWTITGEINVKGIQVFKLDDVPLELLESSELVSLDRDSLYDFLRRFYGEEIDGESIVKIITFEFKPYTSALPYMAQADSGVTNINEAIMFADGGSRGNPGPSAAGFVVMDTANNLLETWNKYLGITTNNQAEYHALIAGMEWCKQKNVKELQVRMDSMLVVNQLKGIFKVKNRDLWSLYETAKKPQASFKNFSITHVPREMNKLADKEVNKALDAIKDEDVVQ